MLRQNLYLCKAEIDYPNRFLNAALVRPASGGRTVASVRSKDAYLGD